jgi:hypothetical protein
VVKKLDCGYEDGESAGSKDGCGDRGKDCGGTDRGGEKGDGRGGKDGFV